MYKGQYQCWFRAHFITCPITKQLPMKLLSDINLIWQKKLSFNPCVKQACGAKELLVLKIIFVALLFIC